MPHTLEKNNRLRLREPR